MFIQKQMPKLFEYLSTKIIDVTTFKLLCYRWNYKVSKMRPYKAVGHRAINDIIESIEEMRYYRSKFLKV
jgi:oligoribonuclease